MTASPELVLVSKSPWSPTVRREHAIALQAAGRGHAVTFVERPTDARALRSASAWSSYAAELALGARALGPEQGRPRVVSRSTLAPGHRGVLALRAETPLLARDLGRVGVDERTSVVATAPWYWPAVYRSRAGRKVVDLADDWSALIPARAAGIRELHARIGAEADEILVASPALVDLFPGRDVVVVRNGADDTSVLDAPTARPRTRTLVAVGTLSERFDDARVGALMDALPGWQLTLHGEQRYSAGPAAAGLGVLLGRVDGRVRYLGVLPRSGLSTALDAADALVIVHRRDQSTGQDSMKMYDYAARGRPVVTTPASLPAPDARPPHLYVADDAAGLAAAVLASVDEPEGHAQDRVRWAEQNLWATRFPRWWAAATGGQGR